jgi:hypothetical protein
VTDIQESKAIVLDYFDALERAPADMTAEAIRPFAAADYSFRGVHPFNELNDVDSVAAKSQEHSQILEKKPSHRFS